MKKIILLFALLVLALNNIEAKQDRLYANIKNVVNATYENEVFTWTGTSGQYMDLFSGLTAGDLSNYKTLHLTITDLTTDNFRIQYKGTSDNTVTYSKSDITDGNLDIAISDISNASSVTIIRLFCSSNATGSLKISPYSVYLEKEVTGEWMDITTSITSTSDKDTPFAWAATGTLSTINNKFTSPSDQGYYFGYNQNNSLANGYFDLTGYTKVGAKLTSYDSSKSLQMRVIAGANCGSNTSISFVEGRLVYFADLSATKCTSIRAAQGATDHQAMTSIDFIKEFDVTSTTAFNIAASVSSSVAYDRTFTVGQKSTVCLPFALTAEEVTAAGTFYKLTSVEGGILHFTEQSTTKAYVPYVFVPAATNPFANLSAKAIVATPTDASDNATTVGGYTFQGTMAHQTLPSDVFGYNSSTGAFSKTTSAAVTIDAFRGYIKTSTSNAISFLDCTFDAENVTGITEMKGEEAQQDKRYYNLKGQVVENPTKGLYIVNGKKIVIK